MLISFIPIHLERSTLTLHVLSLIFYWSIARRTAIALTCKIGAAGSRRLGDHGDNVLCFLLRVVHCCVCKRRLVLGCPPLAHKYDISYYGIILGVGISIVVLDTHAILVKYLAGENGGREKNDKSVVCVVCCKKLLLQRFYQRQIWDVHMKE